MSNLNVNVIIPRTTSNIDIQGVSKPTYLSSPIALTSETVQLTGSTMTGQLSLPATTSNAAHATRQDYVLSQIAAIGNIHSFTTNGYYVGPGGIVLQWGIAAFADPPGGVPGQTGSVSFPYTFPNSCLIVNLGTSVTAGGTSNWNASVTAMTTTTFSYQVQEWSASVGNSGSLNWIAIGY